MESALPIAPIAAPKTTYAIAIMCQIEPKVNTSIVMLTEDTELFNALVIPI